MNEIYLLQIAYPEHRVILRILDKGLYLRGYFQYGMCGGAPALWDRRNSQESRNSERISHVEGHTPR